MALIVELDASEFDAHCSKPILNLSWLVYKSCFVYDSELANIFDFLESNGIETLVIMAQGCLLYLDEGHRSGEILTTVIGTIYNALI